MALNYEEKCFMEQAPEVEVKLKLYQCDWVVFTQTS